MFMIGVDPLFVDSVVRKHLVLNSAPTNLRASFSCNLCQLRSDNRAFLFKS